MEVRKKNPFEDFSFEQHVSEGTATEKGIQQSRALGSAVKSVQLKTTSKFCVGFHFTLCFQTNKLLNIIPNYNVDTFKCYNVNYSLAHKLRGEGRASKGC